MLICNKILLQFLTALEVADPSIIDAHSINRVTTVELVQDVKILASAAYKRDLIFLEAILLKEH